MPVPITVGGTIVPVMSVTLAPGESVTVNAKWSGVYYAHAKAWHRGALELDMNTRQFCHCDADAEEPGTTSSTSPSTSTSTATTTEPPPPTDLDSPRRNLIEPDRPERAGPVRFV